MARINYIRRKKLQKEISRILGILEEKYKPQKVVLFGSLCSGKISELSDIDLLIVKNVRKRYLDRIDEFMDLVNPKVAIDVFIFTPQELKNPNPYIKEILENGKLLYG